MISPSAAALSATCALLAPCPLRSYGSSLIFPCKLQVLALQFSFYVYQMPLLFLQEAPIFLSDLTHQSLPFRDG